MGLSWPANCLREQTRVGLQIREKQMEKTARLMHHIGLVMFLGVSCRLS